MLRSGIKWTVSTIIHHYQWKVISSISHPKFLNWIFLFKFFFSSRVALQCNGMEYNSAEKPFFCELFLGLLFYSINLLFFTYFHSSNKSFFQKNFSGLLKNRLKLIGFCNRNSSNFIFTEIFFVWNSLIERFEFDAHNIWK